jgi:hypothetical protein
MALQLSNAAAQALVGDGTNKGLGAYIGTNAYFIFYSGAQASGGPESGTLPSGALNTTGSGNAVIVSSWTDTGNGVLTANISATAGACNSSGTAASFVLFTSGGTPVLSGNVGTSASDINMSTVTFVSGAAIALSAFSITYSPH